MELMERIKAECEKHEDSCLGCLLHTENGCPCADYVPFGWDIEAIRKALDDEIDGAVVGEEKSCTRVDGAVESVVEEIVVPEKWETVYEALGKDKEEEIVVPKKWNEYAFDYYPKVVGHTAIEKIMLKQNEIINCLEQIKEKLK